MESRGIIWLRQWTVFSFEHVISLADLMQIKPATHQRPQSSRSTPIWDGVGSRLKSMTSGSPPLLQSGSGLFLVSFCDDMSSDKVPTSLHLRLLTSGIIGIFSLCCLINLFPTLTVDGHL
jgi:hypothetical protein